MPTKLGVSNLILPQAQFCHHLLLSDVKQRYHDHQNPNIIVPIQDLMVPFAATLSRPLPCKYSHQPDIAGKKVIVRNGPVLSSIYDSKKFHQTVPYCNSVSSQVLCSWYTLFSGHGNTCRIYIILYELFSQGHGGGQGFVFGEELPPHKSGYDLTGRTISYVPLNIL